MTLTEVLAELGRLGIVATAKGDRLHLDAPRGALTTALRSALAEHKPALLLHLVRATDEVAEAEGEYHRLWLRCCHLDDQLQAAKEDGAAEQVEWLRAELSALVDGPYTAARLRYDAALHQAPGVAA